MPVQRTSGNEANDPCIPRPIARVLEKLSNNTSVLENIENLTNILVEYFLTNPTEIIDYFNHVDGDVSNYVARHQPGLPIQLTTNMSESGGVYTASAKLLTWGGSSYSVTGNAATITDVFNGWGHAMSGDRGFVGYESISGRNVLCPTWLNTPLIRTGVLDDTDLAATTLASPSTPSTVVVDSVNFSVYGVMVPVGLAVPNASTTYVTFSWDFVAKKHFAISTNVCPE